MTTKEEREHVIEVLEKYYNSEPFQIQTKLNPVLRDSLKFAIDSIKVDLAYDLEYERTTEQIPVTLNITEVKKHKSDFSDLEDGKDNNVPSIIVEKLKEIREDIDKLMIPDEEGTIEGSFAYCEALADVDKILDKKISELCKEEREDESEVEG